VKKWKGKEKRKVVILTGLKKEVELKNKRQQIGYTNKRSQGEKTGTQIKR